MIFPTSSFFLAKKPAHCASAAALSLFCLAFSTLPAAATQNAERPSAKKSAPAAAKPAVKKPANSSTSAAKKAAAAKKAVASTSGTPPAAKSTAKAKAAASAANRAILKGAAVSTAAGFSAAEAALTPTELAIADKIYTGTIPCELGASVKIAADARTPGFFTLQGKGFQYRMSPVTTSSGAVRLEDNNAGAVWIQLGNKSMLMNQKLGIRMADECMSPQQMALAETLKKNPQASLFDPLPKKLAGEEPKPAGVINVFPAPVTN